MKRPRASIHWLLLLGAVATGALLRLQGLSDPLQHDEVYTWEAFASKSYHTITTHYPVPNNHIFHSILVRFASELGGRAEWVIRLPALLAGLLAIPALFLLAAAVCQQRRAGLIAAWILALLPAHVYYSHSARGYTLLVLFAIVAWYCLHRSAVGRWGWWAGYVVAALLTAYTIPSGVLYAGGLAAWSLGLALARRDWRRAAATAGGNALLLIALVAVYWPVREQLMAAGQEWGVDTGAGLAVLFDVAGKSAARAAGGLAGLAAGIAALFGLYRLWTDDRPLAAQIVLVWLVPFAIAAAAGIAGQPRTYLFLAVAFAVAAAGGLARIPGAARTRNAVLALAMADYFWTAGERLAALPAPEGLRGVGSYLSREGHPGDIVVSPFIMDMESWHYSRAAIGRGLAAGVMKDLSPRLLLAANTGDPRFDLENYLMTPVGGASGNAIPFPRPAFSTLFSSGTHALYCHAERGRPVLPDTLAWRDPGPPGLLRFGPADSGLGPAAGLWIDNPTGVVLLLHSNERVAFQRNGLLLLLQSRSDPRSWIGAHRVLGAADSQLVEELPAYVTAARPVKALDRDKRLWHLEALLIQVKEGEYYGLTAHAAAPGRQQFADIRAYFFAGG